MTMTKQKADKKTKRMQWLLSKVTAKKSKAAKERFVATSRGGIRVLEYGFESEDVAPLFIDLHGGGWSLFCPAQDDKINRAIHKQTGVKIASIDYPKAPQNPYPAAVEAVYEVVKYYSDNAEKYKIDPANIGIGGYSAGGNLSAAISIMANEKKEFTLKSQTGFGIDGTEDTRLSDFENVRGEFTSNKAVTDILEHIEKKTKSAEKVTNKLMNLNL